MSSRRYTYEARCVRVVDGDTLDLDINLGFYLLTRQRVRLIGVDTPEMRSRDPQERQEARQATQYVREWVGDAKKLSEDEFYLEVETYKADSFGRWLADICAGGENLSENLIDEGHGKRYEGD